MKILILKILSYFFLFILIISFIIPFFRIINFDELKIELPYYFLILGKDEELEHSSRTDVIILAGLNEEKLFLLPIPRDLLLNINGTERRINSIYEIYGIDTLKSEVEKITGVSIKDFIVFDYSIFQEIGDLFAPINIYIDSYMRYQDYHQDLNIEFKKGYNQLNGKELLYYVRYRDSSGDLGRIDRQKNVVLTLLKEVENAGIQKLVEAVTLAMSETINSFEITNLIYLYGYMRNAQIEFLSFPYIIQDSYVIVDQNKILNIQNTLKTFEKLDSKDTNKFRILITKNFSSKLYNFYTYIFDVWKKPGYQIKVLDETYENLSNQHSYVFFKNLTEKEKEIVHLDLKETFGTNFVELNNKYEYFELINFISVNLIDPTSYDVLVVLNDRW